MLFKTFLGVFPIKYSLSKDGDGRNTFVTNITSGNGHTKIIYIVNGMNMASDTGACTNIGVLRMLHYEIVEDKVIYTQNGSNVSFTLTSDYHLQITSGYNFLYIKMFAF